MSLLFSQQPLCNHAGGRHTAGLSAGGTSAHPSFPWKMPWGKLPKPSTTSGLGQVLSGASARRNWPITVTDSELGHSLCQNTVTAPELCFIRPQLTEASSPPEKGESA